MSYHLINSKVKAYNKVFPPMVGTEAGLCRSPPGLAANGAGKIPIETSSKELGQR